jgi:glycosyltransferase involved in cell wall biosynthesis
MAILHFFSYQTAKVLRVAFFSNQFADIKGHGIARYSRELFTALQDIDGSMEILPVSAWSGLGATERKHLQQKTGLQVLPLGRKLTPLAWAFLNWPKIENWLPCTIDLVHAVALGYPVATNKPYVVTVHDIGPLTHPGYFSPKDAWTMKRSLAQAVKKADAFICVSHSTAEQLEFHCGDGVAERIHVVHEGISEEFQRPADTSGPMVLKQLGLDGVPYILSAGAISPRKNVRRIILALSRLKDRIPHHMVLTGGKGWSEEQVHTELANSGIAERVHFTGYATDAQLKGLFAGASVYVHPSLFEGFGLTVLEAMAQGCPVVTSNVYSLPEVAGDAALLVNPMSVDEIASAIESICVDADVASSLIARGQERIKAFSWPLCATGVMDVYHSVV